MFRFWRRETCSSLPVLTLSRLLLHLSWPSSAPHWPGDSCSCWQVWRCSRTPEAPLWPLLWLWRHGSACSWCSPGQCWTVCPRSGWLAPCSPAGVEEARSLAKVLRLSQTNKKRRKSQFPPARFPLSRSWRERSTPCTSLRAPLAFSELN